MQMNRDDSIMTQFRLFRSGPLAAFALGLVFSALAITGGTQAQDGPSEAQIEEAKTFIQDLADEALAVWRNPTLTEEERRAKFRMLLKEGFNIDFLSKLILGRHRNSATPEQIETYNELFTPFMVNTFASRLGNYSNEEFKVNQAAPAGRRDIFVRTDILRPNAESIKIDWRVRDTGSDFKIVDVKMEGISMAITQRDEFSQIISQKGMDGLLQKLRDGAVVKTASTEDASKKSE